MIVLGFSSIVSSFYDCWVFKFSFNAAVQNISLFSKDTYIGFLLCIDSDAIALQLSVLSRICYSS